MKNIYFLTLFLLASLPSFGQATANFWTKKNDFPGGKRERAVAFSIGDYGYIATGVDTAENVLKDCWRYNPVDDTWQQMADLPGSARRDAVGFALGSKGYLGTGIDNDESFSGLKLKDFWEYDPSTNFWTQKADFPGNAGSGIYFATGFSADSKGYICGGKLGPNFYTNQLWEYKPSINQWTQRANFPGGVRYQLSSFSINNNGYVGLGANQDIFKGDFWRYNPGLNQWTQVADLPGSERGAAVTFTIYDRGYVCMGTDGGLLDDLWEYNPYTNSWSIRASYGGSERKNSVGFVVNGKAYVGTGKGYSGKKQSFEEYTPYNYLGLDEIAVEISVYPNPTSDKLYCTENTGAVSLFTIATSTGEVVKQAENKSFSQVVFDVNELSKGMYFLLGHNETGEIISTQKIILQ